MSSTRLPFTVLSLSCALYPHLVVAQDTDSSDDLLSLPSMAVHASADASAEGLPLAYAGGQVASGGRIGLLGNQDNMQTPFQLTSYTQTLIQDQQAASVADIVENDPAVRSARGYGNFQQVYMVRGLPIYSDDMSYNGLYGLLPRQYLGAELIERVEVLRGANAFLNGAAPGGSGLGGAINIVPKRAPNQSLSQISVGMRSGDQTYMAGDFARRLADDRIGVRLNVARRDGGTAIAGESTELSLFTLGLDYRGERLRISADLGHQDHQLDDIQPSVSVAAGLDIPSVPNTSKSIAQSWTFSNARDTFGTLRTEYDFTDRVTGWLAAGMRSSDESGSYSNPTVYNTAGDTSATRFSGVREDEVKTGEAGLRSYFDTGSIGHQVTLSGSVYRMDSRNAYEFSDTYYGNIYRPTDVAPPPTTLAGGSFARPRITDETRTSSLALADVLSFMDERLQVTLGARYQKIRSYSYDYNSGVRNGAYSDSAVTPVAGVLYQLTPEVSLYANHIEGLVKGDVAPATASGEAVSNVGEVLAPYKTRQNEVGLKYDGGRIGGSLGLYQSRKQMAGVKDGVYGVIGHQRNRGLELSLFGQATSGLAILGGVSLLDSDVEGKDAIGAPRLQANLGFDWMVPVVSGLSLDARAIHTGTQYADADNQQKLPSWTRFDAGVRYSLPLESGQQLTVRGRVENLANKEYWATAGGFPGDGSMMMGAPRTFILTTTLDF